MQQHRSGGKHESGKPESAKQNTDHISCNCGGGIDPVLGFYLYRAYRYLAEFQLKWLGFYSPKSTAMLIILGFLLIPVLVKLIFRGAERPVPGMENANPAPASSPNAAGGSVAQPLSQYIRYSAAVVIFGFGVWCYLNGMQAGNLLELSATDFQSGNLSSRIVFAEVKGHLSGMYIGPNHYLYIPMFGETAGNPPVQLLVGVNENQTKKYLHRDTDGSFTVRGVADKRLSGDIKYAFKKNGIAVGNPVWVVHTGREPGSNRNLGLGLMAAGIVFGAVLFGIDSYRKKRNAAGRPLQALA
ncbi:MAG TPA: hypothetical protein VEI73_07630 [Candidatus Acidoferrum sp.]|nr:hypothetical protein [Candidatus Acidoferrum sp.]